MISILLPSRKRPTEFARMMSSIFATADRSNVEVIARFDDDDLESMRRAEADGATCIVGPRIREMTKYWNECAEVAKGDIFMQSNDDCVFRTVGWDKQVEDAFAAVPDKILLVGGDDGNCKGAGLPHPFVSRKWVETLGYFIAPYFSCDYGDTWNEDIAKMIGRRKYIPFLIEHMHYTFGKAKMDENTKERLARGSQDNVGKLYRDLLPKRQEDAAKLLGVML
jgi:hypothetical protein